MFHRFRGISETKITPKSVYLAIHRNGPISKNDLLDLLGGSRANLSRFLNQLEASNMISLVRGSGRRATVCSITPEAAYAYGAYINGDVVGMGLCDISGNVIDFRERFFSHLETPEQVISFFSSTFRELGSPELRERCLGTTIAVTGPINRQSGVILAPPTLPGWVNVSLKERIEQAIESPVIVELFAEAVLIGEMLFGRQEINKRLALFWLDDGIGASVSNKGVMNLDQMDRTSILGHQVVAFNGIPCYCGKRGCLVSYGAIPSLMRNIGPYLNIEESMASSAETRYRNDPWRVSKDLELIELSTSDSEYRSEDTYRHILDDFEKSYFAGLSNVINVLRPEKVIFCGRLSIKYRDRLTRIVRAVEENSRFFGGHDLNVEWKNLDKFGVIRGSAARVFNNYLQFVH